MASLLFGSTPAIDHNSLFQESNGSLSCTPVNSLPPEIVSEVTKAVATINFADQNSITNYGVACQNNISSTSQAILANVKTKDTGEIGGMLTTLVKGINDIDINSLSQEKKGGVFGLFKKLSDPINTFMVKQQSVAKNIETVTKDLVHKREELIKSVHNLDSMYNLTLEHFRSLQVYIYAGHQALEQERTGKLAELEAKANQTQDHVDIQAYNDYRQTLDRFEKRLSDMLMARHISIMQAPQIRQMQNNASSLAEEIQNSILNVIPAWQQQIVLAVEGYKARQALESQKLLKSTVNDLLKKNSEMLKTTSIEVTKMAQSSMIEFDTVVAMQNNLLESIEAIKQIEKEGIQKRKEQALNLQQKEQEFAQKLLNMTR